MSTKDITVTLEVDTEVFQRQLKIISEELAHLAQRLKSVHENHEFATGGTVINKQVCAIDPDMVLKYLNDNSDVISKVIKGES